MTQPAAPEAGHEPQTRETYAHVGLPSFDRDLAGRTATQRGGFFLQHLRPGMRLLDCGCGPGSITLGLAEAVAPGEVVGLDIAPVQIERARALAAEERVSNARFEVGEVYALPFPDASFDAVHANALLCHLGDPVRALREFR